MSESPFDFSEHAQRVPRLVLLGLLVLASLYTLYFARAVLTGSLLKPDIQPDMGAVVRGGAAALLGTIALPAAIIPLIETGPGTDSDCRELIRLTEKRTGASPP